MTAIARRSMRDPISITATLASPDDLNGVQDNTKSFDVTGASRAIIYALNDGTTGTHGQDIVCYSHDGGYTWEVAGDLMLCSANDATGDIVAGAKLFAVAGVEPTAAYVFKCGPFEGPTAIRIFRYVTDCATSIAWQTGAPGVYMFTIGQTSGALTALA